MMNGGEVKCCISERLPGAGSPNPPNPPLPSQALNNPDERGDAWGSEGRHLEGATGGVGAGKTGWRAEEPQSRREKRVSCERPAGSRPPPRSITPEYFIILPFKLHLTEQNRPKCERVGRGRGPRPLGAAFHYPAGPFRQEALMCVSGSCRLVTEYLFSAPPPQLLSLSSAASMTSSRTTTPATIRRRPSPCLRGARRSTTAAAAC